MAWNGSDGGAENSTQRTPSARDAKNAKAGAGGCGHAGAGACAWLRRCFATYPPNASRSAAHFVTLPGGGRGAPALPKWWRGAAALAIVVVGGGLAWWFVAGSRASVPEVPDVADVPSLEGQKTNDKGQTGAVARERDSHEADERSRGTGEATNEVAKTGFDDGRVLQSAKTNGMYIIEMYTMPDGKKLKKYRYSTPSIWHSNTDQLLHMALSTPPGVVLPPIPYARGTSTKDFKESLAKPIVISPDDSDEVREAKERVIEARETVKKLLDEGYTFEDILADFERENAMQADLRREVSERIEEIKREGDIEMAREYMKKANALLRDKGITEVRDRSLGTDEEE